MNATQLNKLSSFRAVRAVLSDTTATSACPAFAAALTAFDNQMTEVDAMKVAQVQSLPASIVARDVTLTDMQETALALAGRAANYAEDNHLPALALKVRLKPADFERSRLERRIPIARHLHEAIEPVVADLAAYGVTPADIAAFKAKIDAAEGALPAARNTIVDKKAATARLDAGIRRIDAILKDRIDPLVRSLKQSHPGFHERYQAARLVVDRPGVRLAGDAAPAADPATALHPETAPIAAVPKAA